MSVAPFAGVVALDNFKSPTATEDGLQGQVPKPLAGQGNYVLTALGWTPGGDLGFGTVTSVSGTGTVNGITLTGTVTTSGSLTLGGTLDLSSPPAIGGTTPAAASFTTVSFPAQGSAPATPATGFTQYASNTGMFSWKGTNGFIRQFNAISITADRTWTLPDASGTVALTSNLGTIASQNANAVAITGGTIDGTTVGATTASTGAFTTLSASSTVSGTGFDTYLASPPAIGGTTPAAGTFNTLTVGSTVIFNNTASTISLGTSQTTGTLTAGGTAQTGALTFGRSTAAQTVGIAIGATATATTKAVNIGTTGVSGSTTNITIGSAVSGSLGTTTIQAPTVNIGQTATQLSVTNTASAVNYIQVTGNISGSSPNISAQGSDSSVDMLYSAKGTGGSHVFRTNSTTRQFQVNHAATVVNYATVVGAIAGAGPVFSVAGTDADIDLNLTPKGVGNVRFGTYTGTILTPIGYITIKDSGGTARRLLVG
jgi:hypothetical protein